MSISAMTVEDCKKIIRKRLGDYRYQHSVNVSKCAADLAENMAPIRIRQKSLAYFTTLLRRPHIRSSCK